ncbi:MAG: hypothetical protein U5N86_00080 [Planctomycetota bacterium]|nr:hypothetical protein [Planctomycetota bacterium]
MSRNVFNKSLKELIPQIAHAIYDEIKVPRVGCQRLKVSGFTRNVLEGVYLELEKMLKNKSGDLYKICFIAQREGKQVPITSVERVMELRNDPRLKALVVFDPWKIEEYGRNLFLDYSFREFPVSEYLEGFAEERMANAGDTMREAFFEFREDFRGNYPSKESPLREALFAKYCEMEGYSWKTFGMSLRFFNSFPDDGLTDKNALDRIRANANLSRLFIHSRLPMVERVLLLCPRDRASATRLLEFFADRDGVLPEFWLHEITEEHPGLYFGKWCSTRYSQERKPISTTFEGIGGDRRANREITISWDQPYGKEPFGCAYFRIWTKDIVVAERVQRGGEGRFIFDLEKIEPGLYQLQVILSSSAGVPVSESWAPPFWWAGSDLAQPEGTNRLSWLHGPIAHDLPSAMYSHMRDNPRLKRKKSGMISASSKLTPIPFALGDGVQELQLPDNTRWFIRIPEALRLLEMASIEDVKGIRRHVLDLDAPELEAESLELEDPQDADDFLKQRKQFLMMLRTSGGSPSSTDLTSSRNVVLKYLNSYVELLNKVLKSRAKVIPDDLLLFDTVEIKRGERTLGLLTLPTHPCEVAFRLGFQQLLTDCWQSIFRSKTDELSPFVQDYTSIRSRFSKVIATHEGEHFVLVGVPHPGFGLFLKEGASFQELRSNWGRLRTEHGRELLDTAREPLKNCLMQFSDCRAISVGAVGLGDSEFLKEFCSLLATSLDDPEVEFDVTCYGTSAGVIDRAIREIENTKREYCLHDLASNPEEWRKRFPFDRVRLHSAPEGEADNHHIAFIVPDINLKCRSFESRHTCSLSLLEGLSPINIAFDRDMGDVQWSGAGPRSDSTDSEKTFEVVETVQDFFAAVSSKVALQKTAAYSHLKITAQPNEAESAFLGKLVQNSVLSLSVSLQGAESVLHSVAPEGCSVGSPSKTVAIAADPLVSATGNALSVTLDRNFEGHKSKLPAELKNLSTDPTTLFRPVDGDELLKKLIAIKTFVVHLKQTRDGILLDPSHYPTLFSGDEWPSLLLFKFTDEGMLILMIEAHEIRGITSPDEIKLDDKLRDRLDRYAETVQNFFERLNREPDGILSWKRFGEVLSSELQLQCFKNEIVAKDAQRIAEQINELLSARKTPSEDDIRQFPLIILPDARGQLIGKPFHNIHPLCRVLSGEEMEQWTMK